jgi:hypothetical protein
MTIHKFELFADYFQLYLADDGSEVDTTEIWNEESLRLKLAVAKNTLAVGTFRNVDVQLEVEILDSAPSIDVAEWDHVSKGYLAITNGKCVVYGCTDYLPDAQRISLPSGEYSALSLAKGLSTITEEWEDAEDFYKVILWPSKENEYKLLKSYENT